MGLMATYFPASFDTSITIVSSSTVGSWIWAYVKVEKRTLALSTDKGNLRINYL